MNLPNLGYIKGRQSRPKQGMRLFKSVFNAF